MYNMQGRLQEFGLWYAHMMPKTAGGGGDYNWTVIIQSRQWIYNIYNYLFIIYITLIGITLLMIGIIIYTDIYFNYIYIYRHIHSVQVIIAIIVYEKGKREKVKRFARSACEIYIALWMVVTRFYRYTLCRLLIFITMIKTGLIIPWIKKK